MSNIGEGPISIDGLPDIYVSNLGSNNFLFHSNGDGTFTDVTREAGLAEAFQTLNAAWADFDNDGYLDLFVGNENAPNQSFHNRCLHWYSN
jgi:hypothetical protein